MRKGDYIIVRQTLVACIEFAFVHELVRGIRRLFVQVKKVEQLEDRRDGVLDVPLLYQTERTLVVGLPGVRGKKLYILPIEDRNSFGAGTGKVVRTKSSSTLLYCDWDIEYL